MHRKSTPKYRRYAPKNLAMVVIQGKAYYLGRYDSPESWEKYHRLLAEHYHAGRAQPPGYEPEENAPDGPTINELILDYWDRRVLTSYVKDGRPTSERDNIRQALRFLRRLHGHTPATSARSR